MELSLRYNIFNGGAEKTEQPLIKSFSILIDSILKIDYGISVMCERQTYIFINNTESSFVFHLSKKKNKIKILWRSQDINDGIGDLIWSFNISKNQEEIFSQINEDIENYIITKGLTFL